MPLSPLKGIIKRIVTRSGGIAGASGAASSGAGAAITTTSHSNNNSSSVIKNNSNSSNSASSAASEAVKGIVAKFSDTFLSEFQEKEWRCHCGHVFRASGEWSSCEPSRCEAPGCPNPRFFLEGPGREMLHNGMVPPPMAVALPASSTSSSSSSSHPSPARKPPSACGSRFK